MKADGITAIKNSGYINSTDIVFEVDFLKILGIEFGVGYNLREYGLRYTYLGQRYEETTYFGSISIPLMFKIQYEFFNVINLYLAVGPRFNINLSGYNSLYENGRKIYSAKMLDYEYNVFDMDINFSLGVEFGIMGFSYIGIRAGYNLNVLSFLQTDAKRDKYYIDSLIFHITYRYVFGKVRI